ncbi:uncharacterized protein LOC133182101 [Saccostrea echinata]|uniref:uncharacterized protein LOC133182101 n=1 Tax=Saccostrea echinata TaxID=191078 RepID=UPI002A810C49|nr:uncharacterized protein LOC133182101 [Saccostrea echinata]
MASNFLLNDQQNFTRMGVACVDEISLVLEDILKTQIAPRDLYSKICSCSELTKSSHSLRPDQKSVCFLSPPSVPDYSKFDVSLLYTLIRNLCQCLKPSQGWGENPSPTDTQIGDDIERLRLFRNEMFGHLPSSSVPDHEFMLQWKELEIISKRVQTFVRLQGHTTSCNYEEKLANIKRFEFGFKDKEKYEILLKGLQQLYIQTEDFPNITIRGESRILCGGKTCFVAEIENCLESSNFIVTWMKLKGKTTEHLDTNSEKFKGSTHLRLVIQRTLKEDEAEYQAIVQREVNGRHLNILSNKLTLQVFGGK